MRLSALGGDSKTFFYQDPVKFLKRFPCYFRLEHRRSESDWLVHAHTQAQLCVEFVKQNGCLDPECDKLHLCKHFVTGRCRFGDGCRHSHALRSPHNAKILKSHSLNELDDEMIRLTLKQSLIDVTVPDICTHYNSIHGCNKDNRCPFLHVCTHYIKGDCRYTNTKQQHCRYSHNLHDNQPFMVLQKFNIDMTQSVQAVLDILKYKMKQGKQRVPSTDGAVDNLDQEFAKKVGISKQTDGNQLACSSPGAHQQSDEISVCVFHLRGKCNYADNCHNVHTEEPFQWMHRETAGSRWTNFTASTNMKIEESYCRPDADSFYISIVDNSEGISYLNGATINFDSMSIEGYGLMKTVELKRISPPDVAQGWRKSYATQWVWYWKDEIGTWVEYGKQNLTGMQSDINSTSLEEAYQKYLKEGSSRYLDFQTESNQYRLDIESKMQKNIKYHTERPLRRRPMLVSKQVLNDRAERLESQSSFTVPDHWDLYGKCSNSHSNFQRCPVTQDSDEYRRVHRRFSATMSSSLCTIECIERVQNVDLWEDFCRKKDRLEKKYSGKKVREEPLFHGTKQDVVEAICQQNFDWRLSGTRAGTLYGQGSYFHKKASYSNRYAEPDLLNSKTMFMAKVLVGSFTQGNSTLRRPPPKDPSKPHHALYDSCVDNETDPNIFVVFENNQVYPEYIIKYHCA
ncbi:protein mono-ADP-ribosyltransferase PARP12-like [Amphiura filiformis]|uniref:protein mono-ADP-ribosyltransferase PARP12-like n=1 Tax=Amphiura filiformis TaxID=82378 RepID=UPI003B20DB6D